MLIKIESQNDNQKQKTKWKLRKLRKIWKQWKKWKKWKKWKQWKTIAQKKSNRRLLKQIQKPPRRRLLIGEYGVRGRTKYCARLSSNGELIGVAQPQKSEIVIHPNVLRDGSAQNRHKQFFESYVKLKTRKVWTPSEDKQLVQLVKEYKQNWKLVAQLLKNRTGKQVRERYRNKLDPNIAQGPWLKEEDEKIFQYYQQYGSRWTQISQLLGGRSENMIKNRFYTHIRKHYMNIENPYYVVPNMEDFKEQSNSTPTRQNATDEKTPPPPPIVPPIRKKAAQTKSLLPKLAQTNSQSIETPKQDKEVQKAEIKNSTISQVNYIDHERAYNNLITAKLQEMMSQPQTLSIQFQPTLNIMTGQLFSFPVFLQYQPISNLIL